MTSVEFLVVGGGPVGNATALELQRAGREVLLVDTGKAFSKVCGEGLLPPGWAALQALGVAELIEEKAPISEIVYRFTHQRDGAPCQLRAPLSSVSFGVRRELLCRAFERASRAFRLDVWRPAVFREMRLGERFVEAEVEHGGRSESVRCRYLIGADGLHSRVRRLAGLESTQPRSFSRWGCRVYLQGRHQVDGVTVTLGEDLESYMTPLGPELVGLAFLWSPERLGRPLSGTGPLWSRLLSRFSSSLRELLPDTTNSQGGEKAIGPLQQRVLSPLHSSRRVALVGDASGYLDALTGEGLCLGLQQARRLGQLLLAGAPERYPAAHRQIEWRHQLVVNSLLRLLSTPWLKHRVLGGLAATPDLFPRLVGVAVEEQSPMRLLGPDLLRFLGRLTTGVRR